MSGDLTDLRNLAIALLVGALVGIERERHKSALGVPGIAGLRTFILLAQIGAVAAWMTRELATPWVFVGALAAGTAVLVAGYLQSGRTHPDSVGLTTETAGLGVVLLGGIAMLGHPEIAAGLGIATSALLAYKQPLHRVVGRIGADDFFAALRLLIASFIVLPLLPDRPVDPWGALNPASLWLLVVLISTLSFAGYLATRWLGPGRGTALAGLAGGLVSSTAVTLAFARRSRESLLPGGQSALACGIVVSWGVMFVRVVVEVLIVNPALLAGILVPFSAMGLAAGLLAWVFYRGASFEGAEVPLRTPFSLTEAAKFALLFAAVLLLVALANRHFPAHGVLVVAAFAGLTDVDAITLSMAKQAEGGVPAATAVSAIVIAVLSNTLVKCGLAAALGGAVLRRRMLLATAAILGIGVGALLLG